MRQLFRPVSCWRVSEVISLWLGSLVGGPLGIVLGWTLSGYFVEAFILSDPSEFPSDDPWEGVGIILYSAALAGLIGAVLAVWIPLRLIHAPRAGPSALVSCLLMIVLVPLTARVGAGLIPFNIRMPYSAILVVTIASLVCALVTYMFVTSRGRAKLVSEPA